MNSQFIFKIAVYKNKEASGDGEIRKFQVSQTNSTNYSQLLAKLKSYYKFAGVQIFWTDSEFDEIKIDSDEDLAMAQNESGTGTLKLKVILEGFENSSENVGDDDEAMELESDGHDTDAGGKAEEKSVDGNYVLSLMVYVVQCLGLQPCQSDQPGELSVTSYMIRVAAGLSTRLTKSALLMSSLCLLTLLSMFLPSFIINSVIYFILAFSLGLPIATLVLGHFLFALISVSPNFVVTFLSMWALRSLIYRKRQQLLRLNLDYWNSRLEQTLSEEMQRNIKQE